MIEASCKQLQENSLYTFDYKNAVCVCVHVYVQYVSMHSTHIYA